jgi:SAM-dependent methyltransferase
VSLGDIRFTGERLHAGTALFAVDLARHRAAYEIARTRRVGTRLLDLGCGSGHGVALLSADGGTVVGVDRVAPDAEHRCSGVHYCRADIAGLPFPHGSFDTVISFQVIEHLANPAPYLSAIANLLEVDGLALLTTPNRALSDGVNPYHVHEFLSAELRDALTPHFDEVEVLGIGMSAPVRAYLEVRSRRIRRIVRLDPLGLRERLPRSVVERLFAWGALVVRHRTRSRNDVPETDWHDFPLSPADDATSLDWLALCRRPRTAAPRIRRSSRA